MLPHCEKLAVLRPSETLHLFEASILLSDCHFNR